jgi:hypothetical protein
MCIRAVSIRSPIIAGLAGVKEEFRVRISPAGAECAPCPRYAALEQSPRRRPTRIVVYDDDFVGPVTRQRQDGADALFKNFSASRVGMSSDTSGGGSKALYFSRGVATSSAHLRREVLPRAVVADSLWIGARAAVSAVIDSSVV